MPLNIQILVSTVTLYRFSVLEETDINEENSNATSTVNNDNNTSKNVSTMSYKDAVVNKG